MFAKNLEYYRLKRGLTKKELAQKTGVSTAMITYYVSGQKKPGLQTAKMLANCLGVSLQDLIQSQNDNIEIEFKDFGELSPLPKSTSTLVQKSAERYLGKLFFISDLLGPDVLPHWPKPASLDPDHDNGNNNGNENDTGNDNVNENQNATENVNENQNATENVNENQNATENVNDTGKDHDNDAENVNENDKDHSNHIERNALKLRRKLNFPSAGPVPNLIGHLEDHGIPVCLLDIEDQRFTGTNGIADKHPFIAVNRNMSAEQIRSAIARQLV